IRLKIQTKSSHKTHKSQLLRLDFVNLKSWIAITHLSLCIELPVQDSRIFENLCINLQIIML
ncbi:hypothetical protein, partial [uncultured Ruminococcus sp.]|uniref:hypothetical protein n=1 Tax=uncultured Ruminococcus sp. TaxID=165186 RepID=UPI0025F3DD89